FRGHACRPQGLRGPARPAGTLERTLRPEEMGKFGQKSRDQSRLRQNRRLVRATNFAPNCLSCALREGRYVRDRRSVTFLISAGDDVNAQRYSEVVQPDQGLWVHP